ncbi:ABC transporter substrate-binding protein [Periweissella cryptocerci]|uniref:ABC transporter substrate-binding protein n=1 Tax=Periweissella cryptocerci TaxID=2506420 RepID=A0A4V1AID2_9LACO|nr:ABC transporter substrate-binding protein [Periweissella cryptocerci]QBO35095.1 ABC transporter substrate-binding protein [Periweissella cryptocerci]
MLLKNKKFWMGLVVVIGLVFATLGVSGKFTTTSADDTRIKIVYWHSMAGAPQIALNKLVSQYNASQTKYKIVAEYQGAYPESLPKYLNVAKSNVAPTIFQAQEIATSALIKSGATEPVQTFVDADSNYDVSDLEPGLVKYYTVNNKLRSMPFNSSVPVLYYNKTLVKKLGLKALPVDPSYSDITNLAKAITQKTNNKTKGMTLEAYGWLFEELTANQNAQLANHQNGREPGKRATKLNMTSPAAIKLMQWAKVNIDNKSFANYGAGSVAETNQLAGFLSNKVGIFMQSSASIGDIQAGAKFDVGVTYLPHPDDTPRNGLPIGGASLWVTKDKSTEQKNGAWDFLKFLASPKSQAQWRLETGYLATNKKAKEDPKVLAAVKKNPNLAVPTQQLETSKQNVVTQGLLVPILPIERANVEAAMQAIYAGANITKSLKAAEKATNESLAAYNAANP